MQMPLQGGEAKQISDRPINFAVFSPDAQQIAGLTFEGTGVNTRPAIAILPAQGGLPVKTFETARGINSYIQYSADGQGLYYAVTERGVSNLALQPIGVTSLTQQTHFDKYGIYGFDYDWKNKRLAVARGRNNTDVVLLTQQSGQ